MRTPRHTRLHALSLAVIALSLATPTTNVHAADVYWTGKAYFSGYTEYGNGWSLNEICINLFGCGSGISVTERATNWKSNDLPANGDTVHLFGVSTNDYIGLLQGIYGRGQLYGKDITVTKIIDFEGRIESKIKISGNVDIKLGYESSFRDITLNDVNSQIAVVGSANLLSQPNSFLDWTAGTVNMASDSHLAAGFLAYVSKINNNMTLAVNGSLTTNRKFELAGGTLSVANASGLSSNLTWTSGILAVTGTDGLNINTGSLFSGKTIGTGQALQISKQLTIGKDTSLTLEGGSIVADRISNLGTLNWKSGAITQSSTQILGWYDDPFSNNLQLDAGKSLTIGNGGWLMLTKDSVVNLNGGHLNVGALKMAGGTLTWNGSGTLTVPQFDWTAGTLNLTNANGVSLDNALMGNSLTYALNLGSGKALNVSKSLTIKSGQSLTLSGGALSVESAVNKGQFSWTAGYLTITGQAGGTLGSGLLTKSLTLASGQTLTIQNTLTMGSGSSLRVDGGSLAVKDIANDGILTFNPSSSTSFGSDIGGRGELIKLGAGTLTLTGNNTFTGGTTVKTGTLQIGNGGASGTLAGNVVNYGTLAFNRSSDLSFAGAISGTGQLIKSGSNTLTLTGKNTFSGGTTINTGTLQIGNGGTSGSLVGNVLNNGTLAFNRSSDITFAGNISGTGALQKLGAGTLTLNGITGHTGTTTVAAGRLVLGGRLASGALTGAVKVANGATLTTAHDVAIAGQVNNQGLIESQSGTLSFQNTVSGAGSFAGNIEFQAAFNPGNSPAAIDFHGGNVHFDKNSTLTLEINGLSAGLNYDSLYNIDQLSFDGSLVLAFGNNFMPADGNSFSLFSFNSFIGGLDASRIRVTGFDRSRLDFSHLTIDGTLGVTTVTVPVPEPGTWALMLGGVAAIMAYGRRRASAARQSVSNPVTTRA